MWCTYVGACPGRSWTLIHCKVMERRTYKYRCKEVRRFSDGRRGPRTKMIKPPKTGKCSYFLLLGGGSQGCVVPNEHMPHSIRKTDISPMKEDFLTVYPYSWEELHVPCLRRGIIPLQICWVGQCETGMGAGGTVTAGTVSVICPGRSNDRKLKNNKTHLVFIITMCGQF